MPPRFVLYAFLITAVKKGATILVLLCHAFTLFSGADYHASIFKVTMLGWAAT